MKHWLTLFLLSIAITICNAIYQDNALQFFCPTGGFIQTDVYASQPTIAMWIKLESTANNHTRQVIFYLGDIGLDGIGLWIEGNSQFVIGIGPTIFKTNATLANNVWTFVQLTTYQWPTLFINGFIAAQARISYNTLSTPANLFVGSGSVNLYPFCGSIDEVQVWGDFSSNEDGVLRWQLMANPTSGRLSSQELDRYFDCTVELGSHTVTERLKDKPVPISGSSSPYFRTTDAGPVCPFYTTCSACSSDSISGNCYWCPGTETCVDGYYTCTTGDSTRSCSEVQSPLTTNELIIVITTTCGTAIIVVVVVVPTVVVCKRNQKRKNKSIRLATLLRTEPRDERDLVSHKIDYSFAGTRSWIVVKDHTAEDEFELSFKRGEKVSLLSDENKLFWIVQSSTSAVGLVPKEILAPTSNPHSE